MATARMPQPSADNPVKVDSTPLSSRTTESEFFVSNMGRVKNP
jgi:hypothetical protein